GAPDLYATLKAHTPDSLQYFIEDSWLKRRFYDNKMDSFTVVPTGRPDEYKVTLYVTSAKTWIEPDGREVPVAAFEDYIDIGITGDAPKDSTVAGLKLPLLQKFKLSAGPHVITEIVHGKPHMVGIDPLDILIERHAGATVKWF